MIIGVTGSYGAGKDTVAEILQKMNFFHVSFSDLIREELKKRKINPTRDRMIEVGNELRSKYGADILAKKALEKIKDGENHVFTSIRNVEEVKFLEQREDFVMVHVTASPEVRIKRLLERQREGDPKSVKELLAKEAIENSINPNGQHLGLVAQMASVEIKNDSTPEKLQEKVENFVSDWLYQLQDSRPDWDHYFMNIADQVKMRCTCMSAKKGAIIVREKMIISTGYNGTPKDITHCTSGGCLRCTTRHLGKIKSGSYSEPCICCHSEENAIVQAAYNGVSTKDTIMYTTFTPCVTCAKMIINAGIREVVMRVKYPDDVGVKLLLQAKVKMRILG
jgi:dCMP deaminase